MIDIQNVSKSFGPSPVLDQISIHVPPGRIFGFIGENGAGKTTLIRCLAGIYRPDSGFVKINGQDVYDNPAIKRRIGYVADANPFFPYETVKGLIRFFRGMYPSFSIEHFDQLNQQFQLNKSKRILQLSKGMKMRLAFMLALSIRPDVLILDEPTGGLDAIAKNALMDMLVDEVEQNNTAVFISSHHLNELERLCDRMAIVQNGRIIYETDMEQLKSGIKKYQVVFTDNANMPFSFDNPNILHHESIGSIHYFIADNTDDSFAHKLKESQPQLIEEISLSLEEIFIHTIRAEAAGRSWHA